MNFEISIIEFLQSNATIGWIRFFSGLTMLGGALGLVLACIVLWKRGRGLTLALIITFLLAGLINLIVKWIVARPRPFEASENILNLGGEEGFSFPSGHSLSSGVIATFLFYGLMTSKLGKGSKIAGGICICLYPPIIAFSRMVLGVHYLTDTIAGIILGVSLAIVGIKVYNRAVEKIKYRK